MIVDEQSYDIWLRRLRFPPDLERMYRADSREKARRQMQRTFALMLPVPLLLAMSALIASTGEYRHPSFWVLYGLQMAGLLGGLLLAHSPFFARVSLPFAIVSLAGVGASMVLILGSQPDGYVPLIVFIAAVHTVFRVPLVDALTICWAIIAGYFWNWLVTYQTLNDSHGLMILLANFVALLGGYIIEQSGRRDFLLTHLLDIERKKSDNLLLSILPEQIATRLKSGEAVIADRFSDVTVLFADIADFTPMSASLPPEEVVGLLNTIFTTFDRLTRDLGLEKIKTIGDAYMVVGGLPLPRSDHAHAIVDLALSMRAATAQVHSASTAPLRVRIGIHSGPVVAGVIGTSKLSYDLWGDTVNVANRMSSHGLPNEIQVSEATYALVKNDFCFRERGDISIKGRGIMKTYLLASHRAG